MWMSQLKKKVNYVAMWENSQNIPINHMVNSALNLQQSSSLTDERRRDEKYDIAIISVSLFRNNIIKSNLIKL